MCCRKIKARTAPFVLGLCVCFAVLSIQGCVVGSVKQTAAGMPAAAERQARRTEPSVSTKVFMTTDISGKGLLSVYERLNLPVEGKVALKVHMGEPGNTNYLKPELVRDLAVAVNGSFVDSNTYYGGARGTVAGHLQAAKEHGFTFAPVDILDSEGEIPLPVRGGSRLQEALVGSHILDYDWVISVAHFKGHSMAGFGGTFKNIGVGVASVNGKKNIHDNAGGGRFSTEGDAFLEKVVETVKGVIDAKGGKMAYINVLNNLSVDCDCDSNAAHPTMPDIGILASTDPVALDKASLDLIYACPENERQHLVERIESRNGAHQIDYAEKLGLGSRQYELIRL